MPCTHSDHDVAESSAGPSQARHLAALADLLASVGDDERRAIIETLPAKDRIAIARLLATRLASEGESSA